MNMEFIHTYIDTYNTIYIIKNIFDILVIIDIYIYIINYIPQTNNMEKWLIGVLVTIVSALFSTIGLLMQKYAHMKEAELMEKSNGTKGYFKCCGIPCNIWFVAGFITLAFVPLPLDFIALSNAGQSLIIPVGTGMTIVWNQILSPLVLKEKFSRQDAFATIVIKVTVIEMQIVMIHKMVCLWIIRHY